MKKNILDQEVDSHAKDGPEFIINKDEVIEACPLNKHDKRSLDFTINRIFIKLFRTGSILRICVNVFIYAIL